jgi:hypothetical protein
MEQLNAIDLLVTGKIDRDVAEAVGVSRQTVCGWRLHDPYFRAELNKRRKEVWGASVDKLRSLLPKALEVLERELDDGPNSYRAALKVLELAGLATAKGDASMTGTGPDDPDEIIDAEIRRRQANELPDLVAGVNEHSRRALLADLEAKRNGTS